MGTGGRGQGGGHGHGRRRKAAAEGDAVRHHEAGHVVELGHEGGRARPVDDLLEQAGQPVAEGGGRHQLPRQAGPPGDESGRRGHADGDGRSNDEERQGQGREDAGQVVEHSEEVGL